MFSGVHFAGSHQYRPYLQTCLVGRAIMDALTLSAHDRIFRS
jgi:hypothetical protein